MTLLYQIIYSRYLNYFLRNINKLFRGIAPFKLPPSGQICFKLRNNSTIRMNTNQTDHVSFLVFWHGIYNYEYVEIFEDIIRNCKGFVDIGSNTGVYSLIAARVSPGIKIVAFDPTDSAFYYIQKNIRDNKLEGVIKPYQLAVSNKPDKITFFKVLNPKYPFQPYNLGGASSFVNTPESYTEMSVSSIALDSFIAENHPDLNVDFVKIDAEGAEAMIIEGMEKLIGKFKPIIVCEVLYGQVMIDLETNFRVHNYKFYLHLPEGLRLVPSVSQADQFHDVRNCFFVPDERVGMIKRWIVG